MAKRETILAAYEGGVLTIWRTRQRGWVEVRGKLDECEGDPLQAVIDSLPGPLVGGELMAGNVATINERMYAEALPILAALLEDASASLESEQRRRIDSLARGLARRDGNAEERTRFEKLTDREQAVLKMVAEGGVRLSRGFVQQAVPTIHVFADIVACNRETLTLVP